MLNKEIISLFPSDANIVDKVHTFASGPWDEEPSQVEWQDLTTDMNCFIKRNGMGALCGYVGVKPGHPWHGKYYDEISADIHGGLTYSGYFLEGDANMYWVGFDCSHFDDYYAFSSASNPSEYRDIKYVRDQCRKLALQALAQGIP